MGVTDQHVYLQAAEDSKQVMENHDVVVDRHEAQQPGGADEQQEKEGHPQCRSTTKVCFISRSSLAEL